MSYSYSSGPPSSNIYQRSGSIINETEIDPYNETAPTRSDVVLRSIDEPEPESYTQGQRTLNDYSHSQSTNGPSFTDMGHNLKSNPGDHDFYDGSYDNTIAPAIDDQARPLYSNPAHDSSFTPKEKTPDLSGHVHKNQSDTGVSHSSNPAMNQADYVGISLVGRKFKEVNPTAYYVEKNDTGLI